MLDKRRLYYLKQLGITPWLARAFNRFPLMIVSAQDINSTSRAKLLFNNMLKSVALDINTQNIYYSNIGQFKEQISIARPKIILVIGYIAGQALANEGVALGAVSYVQGIPVIVSHDIDDLLSNPINKKQSFQDLLTVKTFLDA